MVQVPSACAEGYAKASRLDLEAANNYIRHTTVADARLDPVMEELHSLPPPALRMYIRAGTGQQADVLKSAPQVLRDFFDQVDHDVPSWVGLDSFWPGTRAFFANMGNMLIAYAIGSVVEGFSTLVSRSFFITGRVTGLGTGEERRLRQNNRHMVEVYYPDGLKRGGEGWKISTRIRFVHSRMRRLLAKSDALDHEPWGTPLSASPVGGIALFTFSIRPFEHAMSMGSSISRSNATPSFASGAMPAIFSGYSSPSTSRTSMRREPRWSCRPPRAHTIVRETKEWGREEWMREISPATRRTSAPTLVWRARCRVGGPSMRQSNRVGQALRMAASTARSSKTAIGAAHRRRSQRMVPGRAVKATAQQLVRLICPLLTRGEACVVRDLAAMETERRDRRSKHLQRQARHFHLALVPAEQAA